MYLVKIVFLIFLLPVLAFIISTICKGFRKAIGLHFLCFFIAYIVEYIIYHIGAFFKGIYVSFFGIGRVYGIDAWENDLLGRFVLDPIVWVALIYLIIYFARLKYNKTRKN